MKRRIAYQRSTGQAAVLAALAFILLVGALGLALDGANAFGQRRRVGNAADAASLAATRQLIEQQRIGGSGAAINTVIEDFLSGHHNIDSATTTWEAFYVAREDPEAILVEVDDGTRPPAAADGIRVEVRFTFETYFMAVFGMEELTVGGSGTSIYGPLGTAVGQDLAPLALSVTAWEILKREEDARIDMRGRLAEDLGFDIDPRLLPDDVITEANVQHVSFRDVAGPPVTGNDCSSSTRAETLTYWWCQGSPNQLRINRELPAATPNWTPLLSAIRWRITNRDLAVLPVYAESLRFEGGTMVPYYQLVNFAAVEIRGLNRGVLRVTLIRDYATSGAMVGEGSGVETGVWAVNLTR